MPLFFFLRISFAVFDVKETTNKRTRSRASQRALITLKNMKKTRIIHQRQKNIHGHHHHHHHDHHHVHDDDDDDDDGDADDDDDGHHHHHHYHCC